VLSLQGEIAHTIADEVQSHITPDVRARLIRARPVNTRAHEAYLRGRFFLNKFTESDSLKATDYAQQAVDIDPDYGEAYGLLALCYWYDSKNMGGPLRNKDAAEKVKAAASKALAIDETLGEPHEALGMALFYHEWDWAGAEGEFKRAIELSPNSTEAHSDYAWYLAFMGRRDKSIREATQAEALDPFAPNAMFTLAAMYYLGKQYDQALEQGRKCVEMFPETFACYGWGWLTPILEAKGMYDEEIKAWQKDMALTGEKPEDVAALGDAYRAGGIKGAWRWDLQHWKGKVGRDDFAPSNIARRYAQLGEKEEALDWLEKGLEEHDDYMTMIKADPNFYSLRSEPRFQNLIRRMNFPQ
jgi:tetratricopeptide (TPR) repeat protein